MKKLTALQWVALISLVLGYALESNVVGDSVLINDIISKILALGGLVTFAITAYNSFAAGDVVDFADSQANQGAALKRDNASTKVALKQWVANRNR